MAKQYTLDDLIEKMVQSAGSANRANIQRYKEAKNIYQDIIGQYSPGGSFLAGAEKSYARQKQKDLAEAKQGLVSAGLYNTTIQAGLPQKYEEEVGIPYRLNLQDIRSQRLAEAKGDLAGLIERREDIAPDYLAMASLVQAAAQARGGGAGGAGGTSGWTLGPNAAAGLDIFGRPLGSYGGTKDPDFSGGSSGSRLGGSSGTGGSYSPGGGSSFGGGGGTSTDPLAGAKTIWGDPNVYNAAGEIIGTRRTEDISDLLGQAKASQTGWDFSEGDRIDKIVWDEDRQMYKRIWGGGPKRYGSAEQTVYTSWLTPEEAQEALQGKLKGQEDLSQAPVINLSDINYEPGGSTFQYGGQEYNVSDLYNLAGKISYGGKEYGLTPGAGGGAVQVGPNRSINIRAFLGQAGKGTLGL